MSLPQVVQVSFQYEYTTRDGRQVSIKPNERYVLVNKSSDHWWYVRKDEDTKPFFIPAQYVTELPPENEPFPPPIDWDEQDVSNPCSEEEVISKEPTPVKTDKEKDEHTIITSVDLGQSELSKTEPSSAKAEPVPEPCNSHKDVPRVNVQQSDSKNTLSIETESPYAVSPPHFPAVSSPKTRTEPSKTANPPTDLKNDIQMLIRAGWDPKIWDLKEDRLYETIGAVKDSVMQESKDNGKKEEAAPAPPVPPPATFTSSSEQPRRGSHTDMPGADKMKDVEDDLSAVYVNLPRVRVRVPSASSWGITDAADIHNTEHLGSEGWETHIDKESGKEYYFHPSTGRSTWDYPLSPSMESEVGVKELPVSPVPSHSPGYSPSVEGRWASDWEKVLDESSGRHYFFNPISGESSWDPPEDLLVPSFSDNNLSDGGPPPLPDEDYPVEEDISASPGHDDPMSFPSFANNSEYSVAHVKKALIPRACLDQSAPAGWTLSVDPDGAWVFTSRHTQEQWIKSLDDQGQTYYYLRDGSKSQWNLPELSAGLRQCQIGNGGTVEQEGFGVTRKWRHSTGSQDEKLFLSYGRNASDSDMPSSPEMQHNVSNLEKAGILNKTRISENGKKLRKNWAQSWTVLHGGILTFHKDPKSNQTGVSSKTNQIVPEFSVELKGATIGWAPKEKSSKKNVLELRSRAGTEFLIQYDTESIIVDWHKVITDTIRQLDTDQNQSDDEEEFSDKFPTTEKEDRSGVDKRRMSSGNLASRHPSSGSVSETDQKKVRNKLRKFLLKRPTLQSVKEKGYIRENVFGCDLQNLCNQERTTVPRFVEKCIRTVEKRGLGVDGIYRVSGNLAVIQKLRFKADHAEDLDLDDGNWDIHVITGALKLFFRELQEPLFPYSHFNSFVQGIKIPDYSCRVSYITDLVKSLPAPNHDTMEVLFGHLRNVIEHGEENRMSVQNIAIVFGPTLLKPEVESTSITTYMVFQNQIIEFVLNEFETIFHM